MPGDDKSSKTEKPTAYKLRKAREKGQVAQSQDLSSTVTLIVGLVMVGVLGPHLTQSIHKMFRLVFLDFMYEHVDAAGVNTILGYVMKEFILLIVPFIAALFIAAFAIAAMQVGFHVSTKNLEPDISKLNPVTGFQNLVSLKGFVKTGISILKLIIVGIVASTVFTNTDNTLILMQLNNIGLIIAKTISIIWEITLKCSLTLLAISIIDYAYQKWQFTEDQKMSKDDLKDEHKEQEGNPQIKGKIKQIQKESAQKAGLRDNVAEADVVVTNPFHIAVAIKYDRINGETAPMIVAKGARLLAERIKEYARESNVEIITNVPLARALYKQCHVGFEITPDLYVAVAEVLAVIFRKREQEEIRRKQMRLTM